MTTDKQITRYDQHPPENVLRSLIVAAHVYGEEHWEYQVYEQSPLVTHVRVMAAGFNTFHATGDTTQLRQAWQRLDYGRKGRRWKARFRKYCPLFAHTLDRLEQP